MSINYKFNSVNQWARFLLIKTINNPNPIGESSKINTNEMKFWNWEAKIIRYFGSQKTPYLVEIKCISDENSFSLKCFLETIPKCDLQSITKEYPEVALKSNLQGMPKGWKINSKYSTDIQCSSNYLL